MKRRGFLGLCVGVAALASGASVGWARGLAHLVEGGGLGEFDEPLEIDPEFRTVWRQDRGRWLPRVITVGFTITMGKHTVHHQYVPMPGLPVGVTESHG